MKKPEMIMFDYGQTLVAETPFDPLNGTRAVLNKAARNPKNVSAEEVQALADELNREIGTYEASFEKPVTLEVHNHIFRNYLYEYFDIELTKSPEEVERIFKDAASEAEPTKNMAEFLDFLDKQNIRTSVISNMAFSGKSLKERINRHLPANKFEFIIASSEYVFRKPHKRLFELALRKAGLDASNVWYCGDNAVCDVDGAANCGFFPVWYKGVMEKRNTSVPKNECLEITDWKELMDMLGQ